MTDRCPQRYDDTDILIREITENKLDSERAQKAIQRMNAIHNHYVISNEDYLYDLGIFMCSPVEMIEKFGYRKLESVEIEAHYVKWAEIGRKMNIKDIPESFVAMQQFMKNFEKKHFKFSEHNKSVATATSNLFLSNFPEFLHPLGLQLTSAICTPLMRESLGLEEPVYGMVQLVGVLLKGFGFFNRYFVLPRSELLRRTPIDGVAKDSLKCVFHPYYATYKDGYVIGELGPNKFKSL
ncbi:hypothetical protein HK098_000865 [Nowakowskiella sp. JEL0407]|nr:hypothetical protein HK098_000865 [Nowakowskiella sp. JEL0407]